MQMTQGFDIDETLLLLAEMSRDERLAFFAEAVRTFWRGWCAIEPTLTMEQFMAEVLAWRDMIDCRAFELGLLKVEGNA
jgi:hypothetical protein